MFKKKLINVLCRLQTVLQGKNKLIFFRKLKIFNKTIPFNNKFGYGRGTPIDRYYIEQFLSSHKHFIQGKVLEIAEDTYTKKFGSHIISSDILHVNKDNKKATIIADLSQGDDIPSHTYDCIILTQTLQFIFDVPAAIMTLYRILKPGGVVLVTVPCISQLSRYDVERWGEYWRFTEQSLKKLFGVHFISDQVEVESFGNVKVATHFLHGFAQEDLQKKDLEYKDADYPLIVTLKATK